MEAHHKRDRFVGGGLEVTTRAKWVVGQDGDDDALIRRLDSPEPRRASPSMGM
jgi:hypothetical protein